MAHIIDFFWENTAKNDPSEQHKHEVTQSK